MRFVAATAALLVGLVPAASAFAQAASPSPSASATATRPAADQVRAALGPAPPRAAVIYDPRAQQVIWGLRANVPMPVASLIKMVTAIVAAERLEPGDEITISARASRTPHDRLQWREGATFTADQVMHGMLMESSNGAAVAMAEAVAGSVPAFAEMASAKLKAMGLENTALVDPSGLDASGQHATAAELAKVAAELLENRWLAEVVSTRSFELPWPDGGRATFGNINEYLRRDPGALGVKSGYTQGAGNTLAAASERQGRTHIVVVLNSNEVFDVAKRLMDLAFEVAPPTPEDRAAAEAERSGLRLREAGAPAGGAGTIAAAAPAADATAEAASEGGRGLMRLVLFAIFLPYAGFVFGQRKQQQRQLRARRRAARPAAPPEAQIVEYPLLEEPIAEWMPAFDPAEELPERWPQRSWS